MKTLWAIQSFAVNDNDGKEIPEAIAKAEQECTILDIPPFQYNNIACPTHEGPVIPYGGTKMIEAISGVDPYDHLADAGMTQYSFTKKTGWTCWFNENFKYHIEMMKFGNNMFNGDGQFIRMGDFCPSLWKDHKYLFIRPDKDTKEFAGNVIKPDDFMHWYKKIMSKNSSENWGVDDNTDIIVAPASRIDEEWRVFVVDNCIISGSRYRKLHNLNINPYVPKNVIDYVQEMIAIWQPAPVFVMDICRVNNDLSILEIGDFHSAGWYATDKEKVIRAISEYALKSTTQ